MREKPLRVLITGGTGFVGHYLCESLLHDGAEVCVLSATPPLGEYGQRYRFFLADVRDSTVVDQIITDCEPEQVFHLAAISSVPASWNDPRLTFDLNVWGTFNVFRACARLRPLPRVLNISTGAVYGGSVNRLPLTEDSAVEPSTPYAASKLMAEYVRFQFSTLPVITARPFNHSGPGQSTDFVLPALAKQVADIKAGIRRGVVRAGDLSIQRDFCHVRDVIRAYRLLIENGMPGQIYNVCSGTSYNLRTALDCLLRLADVSAELIVDADKQHGPQLSSIYGSAEKLFRDTGWKPEISIEDLLRDLLEHWTKTTKPAECATHAGE